SIESWNRYSILIQISSCLYNYFIYNILKYILSFFIYLIKNSIDIPINLEIIYLYILILLFSKIVLELKQKLYTVFIIIIIKIHTFLNKIYIITNIKKL